MIYTYCFHNICGFKNGCETSRQHRKERHSSTRCLLLFLTFISTMPRKAENFQMFSVFLMRFNERVLMYNTFIYLKKKWNRSRV